MSGYPNIYLFKILKNKTPKRSTKQKMFTLVPCFMNTNCFDEIRKLNYLAVKHWCSVVEPRVVFTTRQLKEGLHFESISNFLIFVPKSSVLSKKIAEQWTNSFAAHLEISSGVQVENY